MKYLCTSASIVLIFAWFPGFAGQDLETGAWSVQRLGPSINTEYHERFSMISADGLVLYFASDRPDGLGETNELGRKAWDMYVAQRDSVNEPFQEAVNLGAVLNSPYGDHSAAFSEDGHWMYFASTRPGGCGGYDLYVSYREDKNDHLGWDSPIHLGCTVNTPSNEACPFYIEDERTGSSSVYFVSDTPQGTYNFDVFVSEVDHVADKLKRPLIVSEVNSTEGDNHFEPKHGYLWSSREGGFGGSDLWRSSRDSESGSWLKPKNMGPLLNTEHEETLPSGTTDGQLYFPSNRPGGAGGFDIYVAFPASD
jgi:hypothetical protein